MGRTTTRRAWPVIAVLVALVLTGCGKDGVAMEDGVGLGQELRGLAQGDQARPLRDLAGGDWDRVHVFLTAASTRDRVEAAVGSEVDMPDAVLAEGDLFVFTKGDTVVRVVHTVPELFGKEGVYGRDVVVRGTSAPGKFYVLEDR